MTLNEMSAKINTHWMHAETQKVYLINNVGHHNGWDSVLIMTQSIMRPMPSWIPIDDFLRDYYEVREVTTWERVVPVE